jgi:hypothetical protein
VGRRVQAVQQRGSGAQFPRDSLAQRAWHADQHDAGGASGDPCRNVVRMKIGHANRFAIPG